MNDSLEKSDPSIVLLDGIYKDFGGKPALKPLSLKIAQGEIVGLLGHNGAGKSTTFGILLDQVHPTGGEAFIQGISVQRNRTQALKKVGAIFESPAFYEYLSGWTNLRMFAAYSGTFSKQEMEEVVRLVGLEDRIHDPVRVYSHGMRQRLGLAQALIPMPEFLILDEPTEGLDPEGIREIRELILKLREDFQLTVLLSSHLLSEVEQMCDRVVMLSQGRLVFEGCWREMAEHEVRYRIEFENPQSSRSLLMRRGISLIADDIYVLEPTIDPADLLQSLVQEGVRIRNFARQHPTLEDFYMERSRS